MDVYAFGVHDEAHGQINYEKAKFQWPCQANCRSAMHITFIVNKMLCIPILHLIMCNPMADAVIQLYTLPINFSPCKLHRGSKPYSGQKLYAVAVQAICFNMQITTLYLCCSVKRRVKRDNYHKQAVLY